MSQNEEQLGWSRMPMDVRELAIGVEVPRLQKMVTLEAAKSHAGWPEKRNFHSDEAYAIELGFQTVVVMALQTVAYLSQLCVLVFGSEWATSGRLGADILKPVFPPRLLVCRGVVTKRLEEGSNLLVELEVWAEDDGERVASGTASAIVPL